MKASIKFALVGSLFLSGFTFGQMRPGIEAGANYSTLAVSGSGATEVNYLLGYHVRGVAEFVLSDIFSVETGFGYSGKGYTATNEFSFSVFGNTITNTTESRSRFNYLNIPALFKAGANLGESRIYAGVGPDLYFMTSGKNESTTTQTIGSSTTTETSNSKIDWKNDNISRFDVGAKAVIGYEKNGMFIEAGYEHGFINLNTDNSVDNVLQNRNITLTLGFKLGGY